MVRNGDISSGILVDMLLNSFIISGIFFFNVITQICFATQAATDDKADKVTGILMQPCHESNSEWISWRSFWEGRIKHSLFSSCSVILFADGKVPKRMQRSKNWIKRKLVVIYRDKQHFAQEMGYDMATKLRDNNHSPFHRQLGVCKLVLF